MRADGLQGLEAVHPRQPQIEQHDFRLPRSTRATASSPEPAVTTS